MKRIAVLLLVLLSAASSFAQPITRRAMPINTVSDARLQAQYNLLLPRYADTTAANLAIGIDSCGAYIYTYDENATWVRGCSPKRWIKSGTSIVTDNTESVTLSGTGDAADPLVADVNLSTTGNNALQILPDGLYAPNTIRNGIVWGGEVLWISGYSYLVKAAGYYIAGTFYTSPETTVTLDPADDDSSRIDLFAVNTSSSVEVVVGELSPAPTEPSTDPETQLRLSIALVEAGTTEPTNNGTGLRRECIYKENTEWTALSSTARINVNSTNSPCVGTKSVEATSAVNGDYVTFTRSSAVALVDSFEMVTFQIKSKANWGGNKRLYFRWYSSGTAVGSNVILSGSSYGFSSNLLTCQTIVIPLSNFGLTSGQLVDALRVTVVNSNGSIGFYLDEMCLQNQEQPTYSTPITLQNGLNLDNTTNIGELGGTLLHNTTNSTAYYTHTLSGYPVYNYPYQFQQAQNFGNSTSIASFKSIGAVYNTSADYNNAVRLGINYTSDVYNTSPSTEGYFGDRIGYMLNTNLRGHGSFGLYQDDSSAKNVGIFFHTKDNSYTDGITLFAGAATNTTGDYTLSGLKTHKVAIFKTDQSIQFPGYGDGSFTGTATKWLAVDADGNVIEEDTPSGGITADNGLTMRNDSTVVLGGGYDENTTLDGNDFYTRFTDTRVQFDMGTTTAAANDLALPNDGNLFTISGNTQINAILTTNWQAGSEVAFIFTGTPTLKNNTAGGANTATMLLAGRVDYVAAAGDYIAFMYDGTNWYETQRKVAASGGTYAFSNGITESPAGTVKWGGTLTANTAIAASTFITTFTGANTSVSSGIIQINNTSTGLALSATNNGNQPTATFQNSGSGYAFSAVATSGTAINATSTSGQAGRFRVSPSSTNTTVQIASFIRGTSGTAANSLGGSVDLYLESASGDDRLGNQLISKWVDATDATRTSQGVITGVLSATTVDILTLNANGSIQLRPITATAASAITASDGMIVYVNSTDATFTSVGFWARENGAWVKL